MYVLLVYLGASPRLVRLAEIVSVFITRLGALSMVQVDGCFAAANAPRGISIV